MSIPERTEEQKKLDAIKSDISMIGWKSKTLKEEFEKRMSIEKIYIESKKIGPELFYSMFDALLIQAYKKLEDDVSNHIERVSSYVEDCLEKIKKN